MSSMALAIPQHLRMCPKGQLFNSVLDGLSVTLPRRVYAKCHGKTLTSMMGLMWASMVIPLIEQGVIMEGELIQIVSLHLTIPLSWLPREMLPYEDQGERKVP